MKKIWLSLVALSVLLPIYFFAIHVSKMEREKIWRFERSSAIQLSETYALKRLAEIEKEINAAEKSKQYPVALAFRIDRALHWLTYNYDFPRVSYIHGFISYGDEAEYPPPGYWQIWSLERRSEEMRKRFSGTPAELAEYERLKTANASEKVFWFPELKPHLRTRYLTKNVNKWLGMIMP